MTAVDVAIVGGGAVGAACARAVALRGLEVAIFEPGPDPAAASPAAAGMLAAQVEPGAETLVALSVRSRDLYEPLAPALLETTGIDIGFWRAGIAAVAFDDPAADRLKDEVARQRQAGLRCDWLEPDDMRARWPGRADAGSAGRHRLAPRHCAGDPLPRSRIRARTRSRRRARQHDGACRIRRARHQRGPRPDLSRRGTAPARPRHATGAADVG